MRAFFVSLLLAVAGASGAAAADAAPAEPDALLQRLSAAGVDARKTALRHIPDLVLSLDVAGEKIEALRFASPDAATVSAADHPGGVVSGRWLFAAKSIGGDGEGLAAIGKAFGVPVDRAAQAETAAKHKLQAVASVLKSGVFPAQVQFQGGGYLDLDEDNVGEYGFLSELSGGPLRGGKVAAGELRLMQEAFRAAEPVQHGYRFAMFLPDGDGGWISSPEEDHNTAQRASFNDRERWFVCFAWPAEGATGTMFALGADGQVREHPYAGEPPTPATLYGASTLPRLEPAWPVRPR